METQPTQEKNFLSASLPKRIEILDRQPVPEKRVISRENFFFFLIFIYLSLPVLGLCWWTGDFAYCRDRGLLHSGIVQGHHCSGFPVVPHGV